jgi:hypothetical protein
MSIILFILLGGMMALKYIGNESNDSDLRMNGGLMVIVMLFARSIFRISKRVGRDLEVLSLLPVVGLL